MNEHKAIPEGYMTAGILAKKMGTTVRTLQYYDKEGLLPPSAESAGGRRLYTDRDVVRLHQIQAMKYLGFSLDDIKNRLVSLETPSDFADVLDEQTQAIRKNITTLTDVMKAVEALKAETLQMDTVDFKRYAAIVINLQLKNDFYLVVKHCDDKTMDSFHERFAGSMLVLLQERKQS